MAFNIPTSLIRKVQIKLRKEAGIPSYNPDDPNLPNLPSLDEVIAEFNPSPSNLRCRQCRGSLLRDLQSMICIYCGSQPRKEVPPDHLSFMDTFGYRWLLESLDLDGSEAVNLAIRTSHSAKDQTASKDRLVLSDLLDLQIKWVAESEKIESSNTNKRAIQSTCSLDMAVVNLDNFLSGEKKENVSSMSEEQFVIRKQIRGTENPAFPESSDMAMGPFTSEGTTADPFADGESEFQPSSSRTLPKDSILSHYLLGSSAIDLSSLVDAAFGQTTDDLVSLASIIDNSIQDDLLHTSNIGVSNKTQSIGTNTKANDGDLMDIDNEIEDDPKQTSTTEASNNEKINGFIGC